LFYHNVSDKEPLVQGDKAKVRLSNFDEVGFPEMAAALAHEIKNPAAVALAHINILRTENQKGIEVNLNHIETSLHDICELVQEMLFAIYSQQEFYYVNVYDIVSEILETYEAAWPGINFSLEMKDTLKCFANKSSIRLLFSNILKNAVEAVEEVKGENKFIKIIAHENKNALTISICNSGKFVHQTEKSYSNGLGLAICRHILKQLGGSLKYEESENESSTAYVNIQL